MINWPLLFSAPPQTPGSTAGSRGCWGSWGWPGGHRFCSGWMDPTAGWAAGSLPGWCWGCAAAPFLPSAAVAPVQPDAGAAAPLPSAAGWLPVKDGVIGRRKSMLKQLIWSTLRRSDSCWFGVCHISIIPTTDPTFTLWRCSSFSFSWRPMLSLALKYNGVEKIIVSCYITQKHHNPRVFVHAAESHSLSIMSLMAWCSCLCLSSINSSKRFNCSDSDLATSATIFFCISSLSLRAIWGRMMFNQKRIQHFLSYRLNRLLLTIWP